jgi:hypothetical protein
VQFVSEVCTSEAWAAVPKYYNSATEKTTVLCQRIVKSDRQNDARVPIERWAVVNFSPSLPQHQNPVPSAWSRITDRNAVRENAIGPIHRESLSFSRTRDDVREYIASERQQATEINGLDA